MADYTDFLEGNTDSPNRHDAFLEGPDTKPEPKGHTFKQYDPNQSMITRLFGKYAPEVLDVVTGALGTMKGAVNLVSPGSVTNTGISSALKLPYDANTDSLAYTAGQVVDPAALALGAATGGVVGAVPALTKGYRTAQTMGKTLPLTAEALTRAGVTGAATGAGTAYLSSEGNLQDTGTAGLYGGMFGVGVPVVGRAAKSGIGYVEDWAKGNLGKVQAANVARAAAGDQLPAIRTALQNAPSDITASQAAVGVNKPTFAALGELGATRDQSGFYYNLAKQQEAQRAGMLSGVTPNLQSAETARNATKAMYPAAFAANREAQAAATVGPTRGEFVVLNPSTGEGYYKPAPPLSPKLPPAVAKLADEPIMSAAAKDAAEVIRIDPRISDQLRQEIGANPLMSTQGLHAMKEAIEAQIKNPSPTAALSKYSESSLKIIRSRLVKAIEESDKGYAAAREAFAKASVPVNQSNVLTGLQETLANTAGGAERVTPFTNALGRGEESLLKKAGIDTRFQKGVSDVLTPQQMLTVNEVRNQLLRDQTLAGQVTSGAGGLQQILGEQGNRFRLPNLFNQKVALANKFLEVAEKYLSRDSMKAISEGMKSGRSALELLDTLPAQDRNKAALWINQQLRAAGEYGVPGAIIGSTSGKKENQ